MKLTRFSSIAILAIMFFACQKDLSTSSSNDQSLALGKGGGGTVAPPPAYVFSLPTFGVACASLDGTAPEGTLPTATYCFDASFTNKGGNIPGGNNSITVSLSQNGTAVGTPQVIESTSGNFCFSGLTPGQYTVLVYFRHAGSDNAEAVNVPLSFTLTVQSPEQCGDGGTQQCTADGVSLTRSSSLVESSITGMVLNVTSTYTVHNCGSIDLNKLKLQGGLINKAVLTSATAEGGATITSEKVSKSNGNTVLTWVFNLPAGTTENFIVSYSVWGTACGSPISGAWSLKNSAGTPIGVSLADMSATQAGYLDRLYWNCP